MKKEELIAVVDKNNHLTKRSETIDFVHKNSLWHRSAHVWVYNKKREILLQLRSKTMELFPNMWDVSVAGHVNFNEDPINTAVREIKEEIGLKINKEDLIFFDIIKKINKYNGVLNKEFYYVYLLEYNKDIKTLKKQDSELDDLRFFSIKELKTKLKQKPYPFVSHRTYFNRIIKKVKELIK